jgi:predicted dehydrogenase
MKIAILGCGSIGKRHLRNVKSLLKEEGEVIAFDVNQEALDFVSKEYGVRTSSDLDQVLQEADGVFICTPNHLHASLALRAVQNGCHVLVEKPLAHTMENVDELLRLANEKNLTVTVGYMMRFYEPLRRVKQMLDEGKIGKVYGAKVEFGCFLPSWRPTQDYRKNYGAIKAQGGGVILDVIHEINYAKWLFGPVKELFCVGGKQSDLEIDTEDFAQITMRCGDGIIVNMHLDYLQQEYSRNCKIIGEKGIIIWDFVGHKVKVFDKEKGGWEISTAEKMDFNQTYLAEEKHFLDCVKGVAQSVVSAEEARADVKIALAALKSAEMNQVVKLE